MLIDMHAHTSGISRCCQADAAEVLATARRAGIDGLVLCNHYQESYINDEGPEAFAEAYIAEYERVKQMADEMQFALFFGVEVTAKLHDNVHILLYGLPPAFLREHPDIYAWPLEKMARFTWERGGLIVQAHPFRRVRRMMDLAWLDGIEINCHPLYDATHCAELMDIASEKGKLVTCGGDYHADTYRAVCGTYFPDGLRTSQELVQYLKTTQEIRLHVHELRQEEHGDVVFRKNASI